LRGLLALFLLAIVFSISLTQAPLYFSNQNQYFVHGIAAAGGGNLQYDWLAQTLDPTPIFSKMVEFIYRHLDVFVYQVNFFALCCIYFISLMSIADQLMPAGPGHRKRLFIVAALLIAIHSGIARLLSVRWTGLDYPWYFQSGVAGQYVLGTGLQPSAFGVLLVASIAAFARDRVKLAIACSSGACIIHATYLLPAAYLTLGYMASLLHQKRRREALLSGLVSLLTVTPIIVYSSITFAPTSAELFRESQRILAEIRIPHHTMIRRWFDINAGLQVGGIFLAIILARKTPLFTVLGVSALFGLGLTLIQLFVQSNSLSLLFPWRISAVLVPIATTILCCRLTSLLPQPSWLIWICVLLMLGALAGGVVIDVEHLAYLPNEQETEALEFIRDHHEEHDVYLLPVHIPISNSGKRGVPSSSFTAPPTSKQKELIAVDLQRFRLFTGVPIYVDFKSIPYKDTEVLEWYRRLQKGADWYKSKKWNRLDLFAEGITHVLIPADQTIDQDGFTLVHSDRYYRVYSLISQ
jgi:hypothetical protein